MRLLFFIHSLSSGGAERITVTLANYWAAQGWEVVIATITGEDSDFYDLHPAIQRISFRLNDNSKNVIEAICNNWRRIRLLRSVLKQIRPDVAVAMMATSNCLLALAGMGTGVPTVGSERFHPPMLSLGKVWEWLRRRSYPLLESLIAQTQSSKNWLSEHAPAKHIEVIPNPINYPLECHNPKVAIESVIPQRRPCRILLAVGRLERQKGFDRLLAAFAALHRQYPEWVVVILGEGSKRNELVQQAEELGIVNKIYLPGSVGNVGDWFEVADIYILTSRFEGFPNTLLEALAYGLPSIAVDCETGPSEILRREVDGLLIPQDDNRALVDAMSRLMTDEGLRKQFSKYAIKVRERFSIEKIAAMWEQLFVKVKQ